MAKAGISAMVSSGRHLTGPKVLRVGLVLLFTVVLFSSAGAGIPEEIRQSQQGVDTVRAKFRQEKRTELFDRPIRSGGTFYLKSLVGVRWEYDGALLIIYDGKSLYLYHAELGEAERVDGVAGFVGPLSFDIDLLARDYELRAETRGGRYLLILKPRKQMPFEGMEMFFRVGAGFPEEVRIIEETGDLTVIRFYDMETDVKLPDGLFVFKPPPGVRVRERRY